MKKLLIILLLPVIINYLGCSIISSLTREEFNNAKQKNDLYVTVKGKETFYFEAGNYYVKGDSLYGIASEAFKNNFKENINLNDVTALKMEKSSLALTLSLIVGVTGIGVILFCMSLGYAFSHEKDW